MADAKESKEALSHGSRSAVGLAGIDAKILRAEEHLATLEREILAYLSREPARFPSQLDRENRTIRIGFTVLIEPPIPLSVIVGDVVHNCRSALDHLWAVLARSTKGSFPVCRDSVEWRDTKAETLSRVPVGAHTLIDRLQPCAGTDEGFFLGTLNTLSNRDKHKLLNLTATHAVGARLALWSRNNPGNRIEQDLASFGSFKPNTYIEITDLSDGLMDGGVDVQVKGHLTVAFQKAPIDGLNARDTLRASFEIIRDRVVPGLRPFVN